MKFPLKNKKVLIVAMIPLTILATIFLLGGFLRFINAGGKISYNASISELEIPKTKILFARSEDCGFSLSSCSKLEIYEILSNGTGLKYLYKTDPGPWESQSLSHSLYENMGVYDGSAESGAKKINISRNQLSDDLILVDGNNQIVLEHKGGFFPSLGIDSLKWMPDGRHLLIEEDHKRIGIYDTETRKYAHLADGFFAISSGGDDSR